MYRSATVRTGWTHRLFSNRLLQRFGKYSYGIYVLHSAPWELTAFFVRDLSEKNLPQALVLAIKYSYGPALMAASFGLAWLSWRCVEAPFLQLKSRVPYGEEARPAIAALQTIAP